MRAAAEAKGKLKTLSGERIAKELLRLLEAGNPAPVLRVMAATGILSELLPGALQLAAAGTAVPRSRPRIFFARCGLLRLAALLPDGAEAAHAVADALKLSNADRVRLEQALGGDEISPRICPRSGARRLLYRIGPARFRDTVMLHWAARAQRRRPALAHAAGNGRRTGSGRAFRSPAAT